VYRSALSRRLIYTEIPALLSERIVVIADHCYDRVVPVKANWISKTWSKAFNEAQLKLDWLRDSRLVQRILYEESRGERDLPEFLRAPEALQNWQWGLVWVRHTAGGSGGPRGHPGPARMGWHLEEVVRGESRFSLHLVPAQGNLSYKIEETSSSLSKMESRWLEKLRPYFIRSFETRRIVIFEIAFWRRF